jgi:hypothetical protein
MVCPICVTTFIFANAPIIGGLGASMIGGVTAVKLSQVKKVQPPKIDKKIYDIDIDVDKMKPVKHK